MLGGFQELNSINFELVREEMFGGKQETGEGAASDEGMDEVYEDEEMELSEDEDEVAEAAGEKRTSRLSRAWKWLLSLFDIKRNKADQQ